MFPISLLRGTPNPDVLPVFKTTEYPWTDGSFRPLAHARCAVVDGEGVYFELVGFERNPARSGAVLDGSCMAVSFQFFETPARLLTVAVAPDGRSEAYVDGEPWALALPVSVFAGEDEQGWYHGVRFLLPSQQLFSLYGRSKMAAGHKMKGNIYKFKRTGGDSHMGAVGPMAENSIFSTRNLCDFCVEN
ncbi:MAG: hypothetical protein VB092_04555 [Oscillospiraceae bacterium]|nr:hypothetical protein [Oscillospiraceae bacterium]